MVDRTYFQPGHRVGLLNAINNSFYGGYTRIVRKTSVRKFCNKKSDVKGLCGRTGTPIFEDAHPRHLNQPDLYLVKVEGTLDPSCKSRRSGTKLRSNGSSKAAASL